MKAVVLSEMSVSSYYFTSCNTSEDLNPYHWCQLQLAGICFVADAHYQGQQFVRKPNCS